MLKNKRLPREIPHIHGGWMGEESIPTYLDLRRDRYTMEEIAQAFGMPVRTLYYRIGAIEKASGAQTPTGQDRQRMDVDAAINADSTTIPA